LLPWIEGKREECPPPLEREQQSFLLPHGRERGDGKSFPRAVCEGKRQREGRHNEEERGEGEIMGQTIGRKEKWAREYLSKCAQPEPLRAALPPSLIAERL